jgi:hypothetical protein
MSTDAPPYPDQPETVALKEQTLQVGAIDHDDVTDSLRVLDHRARRRAVAPHRARRGVYLAFRADDVTKLVPLEQRVTHIGRGAGADLRLEDQRVSRSHAIIVRHGRFARVLDNRSSNGTYINGRRIIATNLTDGDVIGVGPVAIQYREIS